MIDSDTGDITVRLVFGAWGVRCQTKRFKGLGISISILFLIVTSRKETKDINK
jgi:hypothetical protein